MHTNCIIFIKNCIVKYCGLFYVKFKSFVCRIAIVTSSMATEMVQGKTGEEKVGLTNKAVMEAAGGLPPEKVL